MVFKNCCCGTLSGSPVWPTCQVALSRGWVSRRGVSPMAPGQRYAVPALECYVEYAGRCPLKGITAHGDGEHVYQLRPYGLESREFPDLAVAQRRRSTMDSAQPVPSLRRPGGQSYLSFATKRLEEVQSLQSSIFKLMV